MCVGYNFSSPSIEVRLGAQLATGRFDNVSVSVCCATPALAHASALNDNASALNDNASAFNDNASALDDRIG